MKKYIILFVVFSMLCSSALADICVTGNGVNLRSGPDTDFPVVANVPQGTMLGDMGYTGSDKDGADWYWVEYQGEKCWVSTKYAEREVISYDAALAADFPHKELLGRWKMTSYSINGSKPDDDYTFEIVGAGMILSLVHGGDDGAYLQADIQMNDGEYTNRHILPAICENIPVTAWRNELANVEAHNLGWSVRLDNPEEDDDWDFYIDPSDNDHLTMYWMLNSDKGYIDVFEFERIGEEDYDDGSVPDAWKSFDTELLPGIWEAAYGRIDTYSYEDAKAEDVASELSFYRYEHGEIWMDWTQNDATVLYGIRITPLDARSMHESLDAPWYVDLTRLEEHGRRAYMYLEDAETLCLIEEYTIDGMPASDCIVFKRTDY